MTLGPLREARALGYRLGILHSSRMGMGVYRQLGFEEHCRMSHYNGQVKRANDRGSGHRQVTRDAWHKESIAPSVQHGLLLMAR